MSPVYLSEKVSLYQATRTNLRPECGRDDLMFNCSLQQRKNETCIIKMIIQWNELPVNLRSLDKFEPFKTRLKTYYFRQAFSQYC